MKDKIVKRGEVWIAELGKGVGSEQRGRRPVLIMQNDMGNKYSDTVTIIPLSRKNKREDLKIHIVINESFLVSKSEVLVEQVRTIDKQRLSFKIGKLSKENQRLVDNAFLIQNGFESLVKAEPINEIL